MKHRLLPKKKGGKKESCFKTFSHSQAREAIYKLQDAARQLETNLEKNKTQLAPAKSQFMLFTKKRKIPNGLPNIILAGGMVPKTEEAKFLGVKLDSKLKWTNHIQYMVAKMNKRVNFIRSLSGHWWGSHPMTLIRAYQALVRSVTDYAAGVYDPTTKKNWNHLELPQRQGLRVCLGAMKSSPIVAIQAEAAQMPLKNRLNMLTDRAILKWHSITNHPVINLLNSWAGAHRTKRKQLLLKRFEKFPVDPNQIEKSPVPKCYSVQIEKLTSTPEININFPPIPYVAKESEDEKEIFKYLIKTTWKNYHILSTDGSKGNPEENVGAAMVDYSGRPIKAKMLKLQPNTEIYEAEAKALHLALVHAEEINPGHGKEILILVDNKGLLLNLTNFIREQESSTISDIREKLANLEEIGTKVKLNWVPSHKKISPNELADYFAKLARKAGKEENAPQHYSTFSNKIKHQTEQEVQQNWENHPKGRKNYRIQPTFPKRPWIAKAPDQNRNTLATIIRLRIGHTHCPAHLHRINAIPSPVCSRCGEIADDNHLLNNCKFTDKSAFEDILKAEGLETQYPEIFKVQKQEEVKTVAEAFKQLLAANSHLKL
ncbi:uncharacterized protein LOC117648462 [Thrips palmi]|uniref:Uncharacterized protein LOC117648462 n=1 Tax=Thrips palmi TaxID=161013 RepID=A0A6P8Z2Z7_THRPL|nr:uncharacterized protein LOC117648462 [Thrips palmi]